jgi:hypothetical protein
MADGVAGVTGVACIEGIEGNSPRLHFFVN